MRSGTARTLWDLALTESYMFQWDRQYWGRPADVLVMANGNVLVADDLNGAIYLVSR